LLHPQNYGRDIFLFSITFHPEENKNPRRLFDFSVFGFPGGLCGSPCCCRQQTESFSSAAGNYFFDFDEKKKVKRTESDPLVFFPRKILFFATEIDISIIPRSNDKEKS